MIVLNDSENFVRSSCVWKTMLAISEQNFGYILLWKTVLHNVNKDLGYFILKKTVLNNLGKICQDTMSSENGVRYFK